jgi:4-oxalocrotonate tautomerase
MPFVRIDVLAGRPPARLEALIAAVSETVARTLDVPIERVRVVINEVPPHLWGIGGVPASRVPGRVPGAAADPEPAAPVADVPVPDLAVADVPVPDPLVPDSVAPSGEEVPR